MSELKPCPFCGSKKAPRALTVAECELMDEDDNNYKWSSEHYTVVCGIYEGGCGASIKCNNETEEAAIEAWNRRVTDDKRTD